MPLSQRAQRAKDRASTAGTRLEHRHFRVIAEVVRGLHPVHRARVAQAFATRLQCTNPSFNAARFLDACAGDP